MSSSDSNRLPEAADSAPGLQIPLTASTGFLLARVGGESRKWFTQSLLKHGLRTSHYAVLMALAGIGPMSQQSLAGLIGVDPRNLVGVIDLLQERGLLEREPDPTDRRRHAVNLTSAGRDLLAQLRLEGERLELRMLAALNASERSTLHQLLLRLLPVVSDKEELD